MQITMQQNLQSVEVRSNDFNHIFRVMDELKHMPTKEKVHFPLPSRSGVYADVECSIGYNDQKPYGEFTFINRKHGMVMAHTAIVTHTVQNGELVYELQIKPNRQLRKNPGNRSMISVHPDPKAVAKAICLNYFVGSAGRKVIPLVGKEHAK